MILNGRITVKRNENNTTIKSEYVQSVSTNGRITVKRNENNTTIKSEYVQSVSTNHTTGYIKLYLAPREILSNTYKKETL